MMNIENPSVLADSTNPMDPIVIQNDSLPLEGGKVPVDYANKHVIVAEMISVMALFRMITEIMQQFAIVSRDYAMKNEQLYAPADFRQVQESYEGTVDSLNKKLSLNLRAAIIKATSGGAAAVAGVGAAKYYGAAAASGTMQLVNTAPNHVVEAVNLTPQTQAEIENQEANTQLQQSKVYAQTQQNAAAWRDKMSDMLAQTCNMAVQIFQQLGRMFSNLS
jgi:hypothetical protein